MPKSKVRSKAYSLLLYPDNDNHMITLGVIKQCYKYAYILHNKDREKDLTEKKDHVHCVVIFNTQKYLDNFCEEIGIDSRFVQKVQNLKSSIRYLIHKDDIDKYQYNEGEIVTNMNWINITKYLYDELSVEEKAEKIIDIMVESDSLYEVIIKSINTHVYDELRRMGNIGIKLFEEMKGHKNGKGHR